MTVTNEEEEQKDAQRRRRRKKKGRRSHVMDVWVNKAAHKKADENVWNQTSNSRSSSASNMYPRCVTSVCLRQPSVTGSYRSERHAHMYPPTSCRFYTCSRIELGSSKVLSGRIVLEKKIHYQLKAAEQRATHPNTDCVYMDSYNPTIDLIL